MKKNYFENISEELKSVSVNEMYEIIIEFGEDIKFPKELMTEENRVKGCVNRAYISCSVKNGRVYYNGYSESKVVKGYIAILINGLNGMKMDEAIESKKDIEDFLKRTKIQNSLTPSRANAFSWNGSCTRFQPFFPRSFASNCGLILREFTQMLFGILRLQHSKKAPASCPRICVYLSVNSCGMNGFFPFPAFP